MAGTGAIGRPTVRQVGKISIVEDIPFFAGSETFLTGSES